VSIFALLLCNPLEKNKNNDDVTLSLLLIAQSHSNASADATCPPTSLPSDIPIATTIISASATVSGFSDSNKAINGVCGAGETSGSLDVYSLNLTGTGATLKLSWAGKTVKNVSGTDFVIYENVFKISETSDRYLMDPMVVEVSTDDSIYCGFTLTYDSTASTLNKITSWGGFAGLRPVIYNMASKTFTLEELFTSTGDGFLKGGGDGFDLDNLITSASCTSTIRDGIKTNGFKYIKLTSATAVTNPATSSPYTYPHSFDNASDIDGVVAKSVQ
jgi:hypothetical protein